MVAERDETIGTTIRRLRREHGLTQTALGGTQYSKSYVSAVERGSAQPSYPALRFFAAQLGQSVELFIQLFQANMQHESAALHQVAVTPIATDLPLYEHEEIIRLLDRLLEEAETRILSSPSETPVLPQISAEILVLLPPRTQAQYLFWQGLAAQKQQQFFQAQNYFEQALQRASHELHLLILDALGTNYFLMEYYEGALLYHRRACHLLQDVVKISPLLLEVEFHYAMDFQAVGQHQHAYRYYELARQKLQSSHNMYLAQQIYFGLGYCLYGSLYQKQPLQNATTTSTEEPDHWKTTCQQASGFLIQSRMFAQVGGDRASEIRARLLYTDILLDGSQHHLRQQGNGNVPGQRFRFSGSSWLDEAEEQCRQVILMHQDFFRSPDTALVDESAILAIATALAYRIRLVIQRAKEARLANYNDIALRERCLAIVLCRRVSEALSAPTFSWKLWHSAINSAEHLNMQEYALPFISDASVMMAQKMCKPHLLYEVYSAITEVAEELGRAATSDAFALECFEAANRHIRSALAMAQRAFPGQGYDRSYLTRCYQQSVQLLEDRLRHVPSLAEATVKELLLVLQDGLAAAHVPVSTYETSD